MEKKNIIILVLGLLLFGAIIQNAFMNSEAFKNEMSEVKEIAKEDGKAEFINACVGEDPALKEPCYCAYDSIVGAIGTDGLEEAGIEYIKTGILPERVIDLALDCF